MLVWGEGAGEGAGAGGGEKWEVEEEGCVEGGGAKSHKDSTHKPQRLKRKGEPKQNRTDRGPLRSPA